MAEKNKYVYAEFEFRGYTIRVIDVSEEAACKKLLKVYRQAVKDGGYIGPAFKDWEAFRDYGVSIDYLEVGVPEWG